MGKYKLFGGIAADSFSVGDIVQWSSWNMQKQNWDENYGIITDISSVFKSNRLVSVSKAGAKILILGLPLMEPTPLVFGDIVGYDKTVFGSIASAPRDWEEAIHILSVTRDMVDSLIGKEFKLSDYKEAWDITKEKRYPRVLINFDMI